MLLIEIEEITFHGCLYLPTDRQGFNITNFCPDRLIANFTEILFLQTIKRLTSSMF